MTLNRKVCEFIPKIIFLNFLVMLWPLLALWLGTNSSLADHKDGEIWMCQGFISATIATWDSRGNVISVFLIFQKILNPSFHLKVDLPLVGGV